MIPVLILFSLEIAIVSTSNVSYVIYTCAIYMIFHSLIYVRNNRQNDEVIGILNGNFFYTLVVIYYFMLIIYCTVIIIFYKLFFLVYIFSVVGFSAVALLISLPYDNFVDIKFGKVMTTGFICGTCLYTHLLGRIEFIIMTPIMCTLVPFLTEIIYLTFKTQNILKVMNSDNELTYEGDLYKIYWSTNKAVLLHKGKQDDVIRSHIYCENVWFDVVGYSKDCIDTDMKSFTLQNKMLPPGDVELESIKIDYNSHYSVFNKVLEKYPSLKSIDITENCKGLSCECSKIYSINNMIFCFCSRKLAHLTINESCEHINISACQNCENIEYIIFPSSLKKIDKKAFKNCIRLKNITFDVNSKLTFIGQEAFSETDLRRIEFPRSLILIGKRAFNPCVNLRKIIFPEYSQLVSCASNAFEERMTLNIVIPYNARFSFQRYTINYT